MPPANLTKPGVDSSLPSILTFSKLSQSSLQASQSLPEAILAAKPSPEDPELPIRVHQNQPTALDVCAGAARGGKLTIRIRE
jgi:hypothetical protein